MTYNLPIKHDNRKSFYGKAKEIIGNRDTWELRNMKKALSSFPILNTEEENKRLEAVKIVLRERKN